MLVKEMLVIKDVMKRKRIHVLYQNCVLESVFADSDVICRAKEISKFAGTTSFDGGSGASISQQDLLNMMIWSYKCTNDCSGVLLPDSLYS